MNKALLSVTTIALLLLSAGSALAAVSIPFTVNLSENVTVNTTGGTPRIAVDVGGVTRYAVYTSGSGTAALVFTYDAVLGDVDLDGVTVSSPVQLNGGTMKDAAGNDATLTFTAPNTVGVKVNYPSLGMDFTNGTTGRYTLNGTVYTSLASFLTASSGTFARASVGTYYDVAGTLQTASSGTPRFDYDPVTHVAKGILIEGARTNLLTYSDDITAARGWVNVSGGVGSVIANTTTAPDGSSNADEFTFGGVNTWWGKNVGFTNGQTYTMSSWLKTADGGADFTITLTYYPTGAPGVPQHVTVPITNSWTRVTATFPSVVEGSGGSYAVFRSSTTRKINVWGAQLEQGAFATSYIPTTTAAVTRAADVFYVGTAATSQGTFFAEYTPYTSPSVHTVMAYTNSSGGYGAGFGELLRINGTSATMGGNCCGANSTTASFPANVIGKLAGSYNTVGNRAAVSVNGSAVGITNSNDFTGIGTARLHLGALTSSGAQQSYGYIRKAKVYQIMVFDTQLQLLTQ